MTAPFDRVSAEIPPLPVSLRTAALADLYTHAAALAYAGDLPAARALHETIGKLLGLVEVDGAPGAKVIEIAKRRS